MNLEKYQDYKHSDITGKINRCAVIVFDKLGWGFLEKVYENTMAIELEKLGIAFEVQKPLSIYYDQKIIGDYYADIVVDDKVIVELKACKALEEIHYAQLYNYLRATGIEVGLLINFGQKLDIKRRAIYKN